MLIFLMFVKIHLVYAGLTFSMSMMTIALV